MGGFADDLSGQVREEGGWLQYRRMYLLCDGDAVVGYNTLQRGVSSTKRSTAL